MVSKRPNTRRTGAVAALMAVAALLSGEDLLGQAPIEVREVWTSRGVSGLLLSVVDGVAETSRGTIWVSDPMAEAVYSIDPRRNTVARIARSGEGPGEVQSPDRIAATPDGNIAVFDLNKVEVYTPAGEFVRRVRLATEVAWPKGFAVLPSGGFAVSGGIFSVDASIHHFDPQGRLIRSWEAVSPAEGFRERIVGSGGALFSTQDALLYSQSAPHRITQYDYDTALWDSAPPQGRTLAELPGMLVHPGDDVIVESGEGEDWSRTFHPYFPQSRGVFRLQNGHILNVVVYRDDGYSVWQVFGSVAEGLIATGRVNEPYVPWNLTEDGMILATRLEPDTDIPVVVRLEVTYQ